MPVVGPDADDPDAGAVGVGLTASWITAVTAWCAIPDSAVPAVAEEADEELEGVEPLPSGDAVESDDPEPDADVEVLLGVGDVEAVDADVLGLLAEGVADVVDGVPAAELMVVAGRLPPLEDTVLTGGVTGDLGDSAPLDEPDAVLGDDVAPVATLGADALAAGAVPALALDDDDVPPVAAPDVPAPSACAIPDPLASAALKPKVTAPAPSHP